jgi:2-C-methyl-D-erythritol 2,4-cyclodiphosphate synthase
VRALFEPLRWVRRRDQPVGEAGGGPTTRVGQGFDVHRFSDDPARALVLGGVVFDGEQGLVGHSDADVLAHAVGDALLGAAGLGDIGSWFPDDDPAHAGADSMGLLASIVAGVRAGDWAVANVDCTVVCEAPKVAPRRAEMEERLSAVVGAPVTVKGKRAEALGALGRREGIACLAVSLLVAT